MRTAQVKVIIDDPGERVPLHLRAIRRELREAYRLLDLAKNHPTERGRNAYGGAYYQAITSAESEAEKVTRNYVSFSGSRENRHWYAIGTLLSKEIESLRPLYALRDINRFKSELRQIMSRIRKLERLYKSSSRPTRSASKRVSFNQLSSVDKQVLKALGKAIDNARAGRVNKALFFARRAYKELSRTHRMDNAYRVSRLTNALRALSLAVTYLDRAKKKPKTMLDAVLALINADKVLRKAYDEVYSGKSASKGRFPSTGEFHRFMRQVSQANPARLNQRAVDYFVRMGNTFYRHYKLPVIRDGVRMLSDGWDAGDRRLIERGLQSIFEGVTAGHESRSKSRNRLAPSRRSQASKVAVPVGLSRLQPAMNRFIMLATRRPRRVNPRQIRAMINVVESTKERYEVDGYRDVSMALDDSLRELRVMHGLARDKDAPKQLWRLASGELQKAINLAYRYARQI